MAWRFGQFFSTIVFFVLFDGHSHPFVFVLLSAKSLESIFVVVVVENVGVCVS